MVSKLEAEHFVMFLRPFQSTSNLVKLRKLGLIERAGKADMGKYIVGMIEPNIKSMKYADEAFGKLSKEIFVKDFNGGKK